MELHTTESEQELGAQAQFLALSPRAKASQLSVTNYLMAMPSEDYSGTSRCPTSKECGEIIKKLRNENWDLKCRYVTEKLSRTAANAPGGTATLTAANIQELNREFELLKNSREAAERKVRELENQNKILQESIVSGQQREELMQQRNDELIRKLDILDHELELANLRKSDECLMDKSLMNLHIHDDFDEGNCLLPFTDTPRQNESQYQAIVKEQEERLTVYDAEITELKEKLDIASEDLTSKSLLIVSLETVLKEKNELAEGLSLEISKCKDKINNMTQAFKDLGRHHAEELTSHNSLKSKYKELLEEYESVRLGLEQMKQEFETLAASKRDQRFDDISPDLGIESGVEPSRMENALKAPKDNSADEKIRNLKAMNKELAHRLRQTKLALDKTMERLSRTTAQKEQVEKAVCRELHRTHGILRAARKNLENPSEPTVPIADQ